MTLREKQNINLPRETAPTTAFTTAAWTRKAGKVHLASRDRLTRARVLPGTRDYTRFIMLGWYRTGSNWLVSSLNSHPNTVAFSELFFPSKIFWANAVYGSSIEAPALLSERARPTQFLRTRVWRAYPPTMRAVGFKIFYPQIEHEMFPGLSPILLNDQSLRVIHLRRDNLLRVLVSDTIGRKTGVMLQTGPKAATNARPQIELSRAECEQFFTDLDAKAERYSDLLEHKRALGHHVLELRYELLVSDYHAQMEQVQKFLGLPVRELRSPLIKQNPRPLSQIITNFDQLQAHFANTRWASFFAE